MIGIRHGTTAHATQRGWTKAAIRLCLLVIVSTWACLPNAHAGSTAVEGRVFVDIDGDHRDSAGDVGMAEVRVTLLDQDARTIDGAETLTGPDGSYRFDGLAPGDYRVAFERPAGTRFVETTVGARTPDGEFITMHAATDDSDVNIGNGYLRPERRGPFATGVLFEELTRLDDDNRPWPINVFVFYPAETSATSSITAGDLFRHDTVDQGNHLAIYRDVSGAGAAVALADLSLPQPGIAAVEEAPILTGSHPVVLMSTGLYGSLGQTASLADHFASHGYVVACMESTVIHGSVSLGLRLSRNGGPYEITDFDHIPRVGGASLARLIGHGYDPDGYLTCDVTYPARDQEAVLAADGGHVLDRLAERAGMPGDPFEGRLDLTGIAYVGYSMGANRAPKLVEEDSRITLGVSLDSSSGIRTSKPFLWVGRHAVTGHSGPKLLVDFQEDTHPLYVQFPAVRLQQDIYSLDAHERFHHAFRDHQIVSFVGLFARSINGYRHDLGAEGRFETFGGLIGPHTLERFPDAMTERFTVAAGETVQADAGLSRSRLYGVDEQGHLVSIDAAFLRGEALDPSLVIDHGKIEFMHGTHRITARALDAMTHDGAGNLYLAASRTGATSSATLLLHIDATGPGFSGGPLIASVIADLGSTSNVRGLAADPFSGDLHVVVPAATPSGAFVDRLIVVDPTTGAARKVGALRGTDGDAVRRSMGLAFRDDGTLLVYDDASSRLLRVDPHSATILETLDNDPLQGLGALRVNGLTWCARDRTLLMLDEANHQLGTMTLENGGNSVYGSISDLGLQRLQALAIENGQAHGNFGPRLGFDAVGGRNRQADSGPPQGLVGSLVEVAHPQRANAGRLIVRHADGSRRFGREFIEVVDRGPIRLGATVSLDSLGDPFARSGREVLHGGEVIGWIPVEGGRNTGGLKHHPLTIHLTAAPTSAALSHLIEAIGFRCAACPTGERIFEIVLEGSAGGSANSLLIRKEIP